jgi:hypothetical protein
MGYFVSGGISGEWEEEKSRKNQYTEAAKSQIQLNLTNGG